MSKTDTEFCDMSGGILYHSMDSFKLPRKTLRRSWWWHGDKKPSGSEDVCGDCFHKLSRVLERRRETIANIKLQATDKSPSDLMKARQPITEEEAREYLA